MLKKISKGIVIGLTCFFFILTLFIIITGVMSFKNNKPFSIFGIVYSVVPTESMVPDINPGDIVLSKKVAFETIVDKDDIVYFSKLHNRYIVHRVERTNPDGSLVMKGINNNYEDSEFVTSENFISKVVWVGSFASIGNLFMNNRNVVFIILICIFLLILISECIKIFLGFKQKEKEILDEKYDSLTKEAIQNEKKLMIEELKKEIEEQEKNNKIDGSN